MSSNYVKINGVLHPLDENANMEVNVNGTKVTLSSGTGDAPTIPTDPINKVATPILSPPSGSSFSTATQPITITVPVPDNDAQIRYTLDDSLPTVTSPLYSSPVEINATDTIKVKAYKAGKLESNLVTGTYEKVTTPTGEMNLNYGNAEAEEIGKRYRGVSTAGNFLNQGDVFVNSPNSGTTKKQMAAAFVANPANYIWDGPTESLINGHVRRLSESPNSLLNEPTDNRRGEHIFIASEMVYVNSGLTATQKTAYARAVIDAILTTKRKWWAEFRNNTLWPSGHYQDVNPLFFIMALIEHLAKARDNVRSYMSTAERIEIDTWLCNAMIFNHDTQTVGYMNSIFVAPDGEKNTISARRKCLAAQTWTTNGAVWQEQYGQLTHRGGYNVSKLVLAYSNRRCKNYCVATKIAISQSRGHNVDFNQVFRFNGTATSKIAGTQYTSLAQVNNKINEIIESGELFGIEYLQFGMYGDGMVGEFYRVTSTLPEQGMNYGGTSGADLVDLAYSLARIGRRRLIDYSSSIGWQLTSGGTHSIKQMCLCLARLYRRAGTVGGYNYTRYSPHTTSTDANFIIDGRYNTTHYLFDGVIAPMVTYLRLKGDPDYQEMKNVILRNRTAYPNLADRPVGTGSGIGPFPGNDGGFSCWPGGQEHRWYKMDDALTSMSEFLPPAIN